jgi:hypothetical protein
MCLAVVVLYCIIRVEPITIFFYIGEGGLIGHLHAMIDFAPLHTRVLFPCCKIRRD